MGSMPIQFTNVQAIASSASVNRHTSCPVVTGPTTTKIGKTASLCLRFQPAKRSTSVVASTGLALAVPEMQCQVHNGPEWAHESLRWREEGQK